MAEQQFTFYNEDDDIPFQWYLVEAVWWVALQRVPWGTRAGELIAEGWFEEDDELPPSDPELSQTGLLALEKEYTDNASLSPSPMTVRADYDSTRSLRASIRRIAKLDARLKVTGIPSHYSESIAAIEDQIFERDIWQQDHRKRFSLEAAKLFSALKEGSLTATGFKIFGRNYREVRKTIVSNSLNFKTMKRVTIRPDEWSLEGMLWDDCTLQTELNLYCCIAIHRDKLLTKFPPKLVSASNGGFCDDLFIVSEDKNVEIINDDAKGGKPGRPTKNWDAFYIELTDRLIKGDLPKKQSAAAYEMRMWFKDELGEKVGLSTISEKLKPFYHRFMH